MNLNIIEIPPIDKIKKLEIKQSNRNYITIYFFNFNYIRKLIKYFLLDNYSKKFLRILNLIR